jgi:hypothetical protein
MTARPARFVRGCLIATQDDRGFVFRIYGQPDLDTGRREFTDYELAVEDLWIEITSGYYCLIDPVPSEEGKPHVAYRLAYRPEEYP